MTTFIYTLTDERVKIKNNVNNIQEGHHVSVVSEELMHPISGVVSRVTHCICQHFNKEGYERDTHDIVIEIDPEP